VTESQVPESLLPIPHGLDFPALKDLVEYLDRIGDNADPSLAHFRFEDKGFAHKVKSGEKAGKTSKASTATCLSYLKAAGKLFPTKSQEADAGWNETKRQSLRSELVETKGGAWTSAELEERNPFTVSFLLEAIYDLGGLDGMAEDEKKIVLENIKSLDGELRGGGLRIDGFPRTSFLTHKAVKSLTLWKKLSKSARDGVSKWNWSHLYEESMLISADSPDADYFELAYSVLTANRTTELAQMSPRERLLLRHAIKQFFAGQRSDGNWPRSRPLFLYPGFGYAYCYDYELLSQMLSERQLRPFLMPYLEKLRDAAGALDAKKVPLGKDEAYGWSSEHHGGKRVAESWPTASVLHFCFQLSNLVYDAVRRDVFEYVDADYDEPKFEPLADKPFDGLLDSRFRYRDSTWDFKKVLEDEFVKPLVAERERVRDGLKFDKARVSIILFGPPGTSKTQLAVMLSEALGWPLLSLDPSHLTRKGLENVHAETDQIFGRLQLCDQMVVLMDEFDELVREREGKSELRSRFLTTAMLPKIAGLHERSRIVYIVGTNHLEQFDAAISRAGRFDLILPVMPPTAEEKLEKWERLAQAREALLERGDDATTVEERIGDLTFGEAKDLDARLKRASSEDQILDAADEAFANATLHKQVDPELSDGPTWKQRLSEQESKIQGLRI
jgi:ATPase family associated with various cellular activities (AAA)